MELRRILGFTSNSRNSILSQPGSSNIIYVAGCVVVLFDPCSGVQQYLISSDSKEPITTLAITNDGKYLATADCGSPRATIRVWNLAAPAPVVEASFVAHNSCELACMSFSSNNEILVSVGSQQDLVLNMWDWRRSVRLATHPLGSRVRSISFASDSSYFVTVGEAHVKFWYIRLLAAADRAEPTSSIEEASSIAISCRSAQLGNYKEASFCDVKCGRNDNSSQTFCITKQGLLCELNERRLLCKWVDLRTSSANCLAVGGDLIVVGCANGVVRCFSTSELRFSKNLPRPHALGTDIANRTQWLASANKQSQGLANYPDLIGVGLVGQLDNDETLILCAYNDRSIYVWQPKDNDVTNKKYSGLYHSSCIWGIDIYPAPTNSRHRNSVVAADDSSTIATMTAPASLLAEGSFVTCSSDDTIRVWKSPRPTVSAWIQQDGVHQQGVIYGNNVFSQDSVKIVYTDSAYKFLCDLDSLEHSKQPQQQQQQQRYDSNEGLRCLKLSPDGKHLAVGSRSGAIRVFDFGQDKELKSIAAHDAEVLCLEYSDPAKFDGYYYLASSSRDKLIHLFDAANSYKFLQTIDDHSSSITALRFVNNRHDDCLQLISCGTDQKIVFRTGRSRLLSTSTSSSSSASAAVAASKKNCHEERQLIFATEHLIEGKTTFYDMEVDSESSCLMTACQDRMIRLFNVAQVRYQSGFKAGSFEEGPIIKLALDPSCTFLAASCTDKSVTIYDYQRGESVASISSGLSDLVTDLKFSPDGRLLIGCSGNGCIYVWSSPAEVANASSCLDRTPLGTAHDYPTYPDQTNRVAGTSPRSCSADKLYSDQYQVQTTTNEQEQEDDDDDQLTLRGVHSPTSFIHGDFHFKKQDDSDAGDDDGQSGRRYARSQQSATGTGTQRSTCNSAGGLASKTSKSFQSRDNLDKISSRQRYIHDTLFSNAAATRKPTTAADGASLSGRFVGQETAHGWPVARSSRAKSLSRLSQKASGPADKDYGQVECRRGANTSGEEFSSGDERHELVVKVPAAGQTSCQASNKRDNSQQASAARHHQQNSAAASDGGGFFSQERHRPSRRKLHDPAATMRSSRSEHNLKLADDDCLAFQSSHKAQREHRFEDFDCCNKLDLAKLDPNRVQISRELCQHVVDELRLVSKFATRLHQRLVSSSPSSSSRNLANYMSQAVQSSLDVLSIVPPRAAGGCQLPRFPRSPSDLSKENHRLAAGYAQTLAVSGRLRPQAGGAPKPSSLRRSSIGASSSMANVIGSAAASAAAASAATAASQQQGPAGSERRPSLAAHQGQPQADGCDNSSAGHASSALPQQQPAKVFEVSEKQSTNISSGSSSSNNNNNNATKLNIDQVLEAYSDRLFKMVQQRMEWSPAAGSASLSGRAESTSCEPADGKEQTTGGQR